MPLPYQAQKEHPVGAASLFPGVDLEGGRAVEAVGGVRGREVLPGVDEGVHEAHRGGGHVSWDDGGGGLVRGPVRLQTTDQKEE